MKKTTTSFIRNTAYSMTKSGYVVKESDVTNADFLVYTKGDKSMWEVICIDGYKTLSFLTLLQTFKDLKKHCTAMVTRSPLIIIKLPKEPVFMLMEVSNSITLIEYNRFFVTSWQRKPRNVKSVV